jgi:NADPH-dependent 2,4-dienoyl-CoA reductase/sulfur reductase-like enzyme
MSAPCIVIVGGGPAGLRAAERLADHGLRPVLIDEAPRIGGRIYQQPPEGAFTRSAAERYGFEAARAEAVFASFARIRDRIDYRPETLVFDIADGHLVALRDGARTAIPYDRLILATGAMDRVMPLPGWTLPGVFTLGGAQIALKAQGCAIGRRVAFLGAGPLLYLAAYQYAKAGATVAAVLTTARWPALAARLPGLATQPRTSAKGAYTIAKLLQWRIPILSGVTPARIHGSDGVTAVEVLQGGRIRRFDCDAVALGYGLRSESQLAEIAGARFAFDREQQQWLPETDAQGRAIGCEGLYLAGDGAGIGGADAAELRGLLAADAVLKDLGLPIHDDKGFAAQHALRRWASFRSAIETAYPYPAHLAADLPDETVLCRCENVTAGEVRAAAGLGLREINRVKAQTRLGMGRCQGRVCAASGAAVLAAKLGVTSDSVGRLRAQPPVKPVPISVLAGEET